MDLIGLTGGIGSGKSTVSTILSNAGFSIIDADAITRELQQPGQRVLQQIVDEFGKGILLPTGELDRPALAQVVFTNPMRLRALNKIVHPAVGNEIAQRIEAARELEPLVILDVPLLVESGRDDLSLLVVVDIDPDIAVKRLVEQRGFTPTDARARIENQVDRTTRINHADVVIDNNGSRKELNIQCDALIHRLKSLVDSPAHR